MWAKRDRSEDKWYIGHIAEWEGFNSLEGEALRISVSALQENVLCKQPREIDKQKTFPLNIETA